MWYYENLPQFSVRIGNNIIEFELDIFILIDFHIMTAILTNSYHIQLAESDCGDGSRTKITEKF